MNTSDMAVMNAKDPDEAENEGVRKKLLSG
jgi:hypothetical protein